MTSVRVVNPNTPEYWEEVRLNAKIRKTDQMIKEAAARMRPSMIYERFLFDHLDIIRHAASRSGLINDPDQYTALKARWAKEWMLPEILDEDESAIVVSSAEAVAEAAQALYGFHD